MVDKYYTEDNKIIFMKNDIVVEPFWMLKEFWVNLITIAGLIIAYYYTDFNITPELMGLILLVINTLLKAITGKPVVWYPAGKKVK
jgi:hypothetical protein